MSESLSRADKTLTKIIYEVTLDETNSRVEQLVVTTLCAQKQSGPVDLSAAFTTTPHIAFVATYRFSQRDEIEPFRVPGEAVQLLK